ncbi:MAG: DUF2802 domain-containing protein [Desulfarculales bacterium]|jgi:hypothetical protein|nr:DUF2802 domain-containing protein [Desulfarculales bacterium]
MEFLYRQEIWWIIQIVIDIVLLLAVFLLASRTKGRPGVQQAREQAGLAVADFVTEAGNLAREFDRLLSEKRELVGTTLATLDGRISELKAMAEQLREIKPQPAEHSSPLAAPAPLAPAPARGEGRASLLTPPLPPEDPFNLPPGHPLHRMNADEPPLFSDQDFRAQVIKMAGKGHSAQDIASSTGRPRAEVELLLALIRQ